MPNMFAKLWRRFFPKKFQVEIWAFDKTGVRKTYYQTLESQPGFDDQEVMDVYKEALEQELGYKVVFMTKVQND